MSCRQSLTGFENARVVLACFLSEALSYLVGITKEEHKASVVLISSALTSAGFKSCKMMRLCWSSFRSQHYCQGLRIRSERGSEYGFPFRMLAIGFKLADIQLVIIAREVQEKDMIRLLEDRWGMGMRLGSVH